MATTIVERDWRQISREAKEHRDESIAKVDAGLLKQRKDLASVTGIPAETPSQDELAIIESTTEDLVQKLSSGSLSAVSVIKAFLKRAAVAQTLANCITELLPDQALKRAQELDEYLEQHGKPVGPLHGLPISVKEHINMKGLDINGAFCAAWGTVAKEDVHILTILRDAGAVFYVRTTQPQTVMHLETCSNLYGTTVNPHNTSLSSGGSSGGEGALLALRGSCLGIGSDIGGSIRSPAANNGLFGLRPTAYRVPCKGIEVPPVGDEGIIGVYGPLSTTLEGINLFMRTVLAPSPWLTEPSLIPLSWREDQNHLPAKLKVAILWDDDIVRLHPPIQRALREAAGKLRQAPDIELVDWTPYQHDRAWRIISSLYFCDGGDADKQELARSGEPILPLSRWIITENPFCQHREISEVWDLVGERERYREEYAAHWNGTATGKDDMGRPEGMVDVILAPVGPGAAPPHECARYWGYTAQWNVLDYPALVVPTGEKVDPSRDQKEEGYKPRNSDDQYNYDLYEPERYSNAPLSLQIIGRRFEDEKVMQAAERLSRYCHFRAA